MIEIEPYIPDARTLDCILPISPIDTWQWMKENSYTKKGVPFNYFDYPWVKGIAAAWDNPDVKRIFFMAGSRLGKTEDGLSFMHSAQDHNPDVGMIIGPDQKLVEETIGDRFWPMLEKSPKTRRLCPHPARRAKQKVKTTTFTIYGAWSGSPATLGDKDPRYVIMLEVDKYTTDASDEADPFLLAMARGEEIPDRKLYAESTPSVEGKSRIAKYVALGTNRRFHVPCPLCGHHQELVWNEGTDRSAGGLWWDRDENGHSNPNKAGSTAVYVCEECGGDIKEDQRREMIGKGVWCAEGQYVDINGNLVGKPVNDGSDESFQISRLYGPTFSFSDNAKAYVESRGDSESERSFENNSRGMPWIPLVVQMKSDDLARKLCIGKWDIGTVPKPCVFVTTAVDVQLDHFVIGTFGWDRDKIGYLIQHGTVPAWNDVASWIAKSWPHEDGHPIFSLMNLVDSKDGNRQEEVFSFCMSVNQPRSPWVWPLEGAKYGNMGIKMFGKREIGNKFGKQEGKKQKRNEIAGMPCIQVNTMMTQNWLDNAMVKRCPGDPMSIILPRQVAGDTDLFDQLLNERYNPIEGKHVRIDESTIPVDFRDVFRYARTAAEVFTNSAWDRQPKQRIHHQPTRDDRMAAQGKTKTPESRNEMIKSTSKRFVRPTRKGFVRRSSRS